MTLNTADDADVRSSSSGHMEANTQNHTRQKFMVCRSKPSFHITAPHGWLNDPCGPGYDPINKLYHLFFQWNPHGNDWGNMSWGHATSVDCVVWKTSSQPALTPTTEYDCRGVFTGCLRPADIDGNPGSLTAIYTSVRQLPIHYTLPYVVGSETLSLAVSRDNGTTWKREECNPILPGPPQDLSVTGWRDPTLANWNHSSSDTRTSLYGFISGGIVSRTPTVFVYAVNPQNLRNWRFIGLLVDVGLNFDPSRWTGDFGLNWEVVNLVTLTNSASDARDFIIMKVEGGHRQENAIRDVDNARHRRHPRAQLWMCIKPPPEGKLNKDALRSYAFGGVFDHGNFYAANSFWDPQTNYYVVYGWITEEDLPT